MTEAKAYQPGARRVRPTRMANLVADELRRRIVSGELADGDLLPRQQLLVDEFDVSHPSLREAMRILETEGLVSVRRGNIGGAFVHAPKPEAVAYMLALVVRAQGGLVSELAIALRELEPVCAAIAADNPRRAEELLPKLAALNAEMERGIEDVEKFTVIGRRFHQALVDGCGNVIFKIVAGALESMWTEHEISWAEARSVSGGYPSMAERRAVLRTHARLGELIADGQRHKAYELAYRHSSEGQSYVLGEGDDAVIGLPESRLALKSAE